MLSALVMSAVLAANAEPQVISLEVGLVRIAPHRPGTDKTWVIPAEKKRASDSKEFCSLASGVAAAVSGAGPVIIGAGKILCDIVTAQGASAQRRMDTSPDIYIRITGQKVMLRSYTVPKTLSNDFRWRALVPVAAIPAAGLVLEVLNDDGSPGEDGREVIGQVRLTAPKLLDALRSGGLITVADNGIEKMDLTVEAASTLPQKREQILDVRQGMVAVENLSIAAGEVVEVQARGEYRVAKRSAPISPAGGTGAASRTFQDGPFKTGAPGAAMILIGKHRLVTGALVAPCTAILSPYEGRLFAGINNLEPSKTQGDLEFDVTVRPATDAEWRTGGVAKCHAAVVPVNDAEPLAAMAIRAVRQLEAEPGLAAAILQNTHPTGHEPSLRSIYVNPLAKESVRLLITIDWKGGVLGGAHMTSVAWEFSVRRHIAATIVEDRAGVKISQAKLKQLDGWFREEVFPALK